MNSFAVLGPCPGLAEITYTLVLVASCDMCGSGADRHRVMGLRLNGTQGRNPRRASRIAVSVEHCPDSGLVFAGPRPVPADLGDHYGAPADDYWALD